MMFIMTLNELIDQLKSFQNEWKDIPMLARTHGQPASPTRLGKEIAVLLKDLKCNCQELNRSHFIKVWWGSGNPNAHHVAFPDYDWKTLGMTL